MILRHRWMDRQTDVHGKNSMFPETEAGGDINFGHMKHLSSNTK